MTNSKTADEMANAIRSLSMDAVEKANSGHPGLPMGAADVATVLFTRFMNFDPNTIARLMRPPAASFASDIMRSAVAAFSSADAPAAI